MVPRRYGESQRLSRHTEPQSHRSQWWFYDFPKTGAIKGPQVISKDQVVQCTSNHKCNLFSTMQIHSLTHSLTLKIRISQIVTLGVEIGIDYVCPENPTVLANFPAMGR